MKRTPASGRTGLEAQYFAGKLTLDLAAGYKYGDLNEAYGRARLQYYPLDNLMLRGGVVYEGASFGTVGVEYQFASTRSDAGLFKRLRHRLVRATRFKQMWRLRTRAMRHRQAVHLCAGQPHEQAA